MVNGKAKGKLGELEFAALLRRFGFEARRGQQFCGANGDADVLSSLQGVHFEVKRVERLNLRLAFDQAARDAKAKGDMPIVAHRGNREEWMVSMKAEDWLNMVRALDGLSET